MTKTAQPKWLDNAEIIKRLRAARDIALTCHCGAQAAHIDFVNSESRKLARTDYAGLKRHVELWFSRWEAALRDFDAIIDAPLWERIELAARDLEPLGLAGFKFATAHQAARQSLQWWLNLRTVWEIECKVAEDFAKKKSFPKNSPVAKLNKKELAALVNRREVERCLELLDITDQPQLLLSPTLGIDARIIKECKLAEHEAQKIDRGQTDFELKSQIREAIKLVGSAKKNQIAELVVGNRQRVLQLINDVRQESVNQLAE